MNSRIGATSAVMEVLCWSNVVKNELGMKAKRSICCSLYAPPLTCGKKLWIVTERIGSTTQEVEMSFLRRMSGLSLRDHARSLVN